MKYNQTLLFLIIISITFNFVLPIYGNSKQECEECLDKCCDNYKNQHQLKTCNDKCKLEHCDGVKINYKNHECTKPDPPKPNSPNTDPPNTDPPKTVEPIPSTLPTDEPPQDIPIQTTPPIPPVPPTTPIPVPPSQSIPVPPSQSIPVLPSQSSIPVPSPTNSLGPVPPFPPQEVHTCTTPNDPACFPPGS